MSACLPRGPTIRLSGPRPTHSINYRLGPVENVRLASCILEVSSYANIASSSPPPPNPQYAPILSRRVQTPLMQTLAIKLARPAGFEHLQASPPDHRGIVGAEVQGREYELDVSVGVGCEVGAEAVILLARDCCGGSCGNEAKYTTKGISGGSRE